MSKVIIVIGVSGCGKTTVGRKLGWALKIPFFDADDFHPTSNIEKMKSGRPLNDADRQPWLRRLAEEIEGWDKNEGAVLACSALKEDYRRTLSAYATIQWVYLAADFEVIYKRMKNRNHFMKPELLQSQFETLEVPSYGIHINSDGDVQQTVQKILALIPPYEAAK